jgi:DNA (cytosine-5)-methyltransferase 1
MYEADVRKVSAASILRDMEWAPTDLDLLKACPPCQGFSSLRGAARADEDRNDLVLDVLRFVRVLRPRALLVENVPGLRTDARFPALLSALHNAGYATRALLVQAGDLGVPQRRRRLVLIALRGRRNASILLSCDDAAIARFGGPRVTAGEALRKLGKPRRDPWHRWRLSSEVVRRRVAAVPVDGTRFDLPDELTLDCHLKAARSDGRLQRVATASYGRVRLGELAPTMTTRCTTPSCGSFIHPTENRGLSLREAATFQTFPATYRWTGGYDAVERQIGNAVPVLLAEILGRTISELLNQIDRRHYACDIVHH